MDTFGKSPFRGLGLAGKKEKEEKKE